MKKNGTVVIYDWEHYGDYDYPTSLLSKCRAIILNSHEDEEDEIGYIYFEIEDENIPLLENERHNFNELHIN